jgi:hypothetical protein
LDVKEDRETPNQRLSRSFCKIRAITSHHKTAAAMQIIFAMGLSIGIATSSDDRIDRVNDYAPTSMDCV